MCQCQSVLQILAAIGTSLPSHLEISLNRADNINKKDNANHWVTSYTLRMKICCCRYRVYLENEDDECHSEMETENVSTADYLDSDLLDIEDEKENQAPKSRRKSLSNSDPINEKVLQVNIIDLCVLKDAAQY